MTRTWSPIDASVVDPILRSGCTYELPRDIWPFGSTESQFLRMFIYGLAANEETPSVATTALVVARLLSERFDSKDTQPINYDWYSIMQRSDGAFFQSGPHKDIDFGHHLSSPISLASLGHV